MKYIKDFLNKYKNVIFMTMSFLILDFVLRYFTKSINFYNIYSWAPDLFTIVWTILFVGISTCFKDKTSKILYIIFISFSIILFLTHTIYFSYFKNFFDFSSLRYAGEAKDYLVD